jgi:glutaredoxin
MQVTPRKAFTWSAITAALAMAVLSNTAVQAQQVYRIVGPDGKVTFSDRAPDNQAQPQALANSGARNASANLPYELAQVAGRYPVTLYTGKDCTPCDSARSLLSNRGVPFAERTISSNEDINALKRLSGDTSLPLVTIGGQQLAGFSDSEWTQYLDAAGYPKQSQLPASYRRPVASPLVAVVDKAPAAETAPAAPAPAPATAPQTPREPRRNNDNPANISF